MNARQIVIEEARRAGVDPAIALSIWEQESGGSTDTSVRGQTLPSGKWKGHYARGPWQIMSFHGDIPNDFQGQTRWAMQHLKERGVRGYYGEGSPVVPGHPTTDEYEASVRARAGRMNIDPRMASAAPMAGVPPTDPNMLPDRGANQMTPVATPGFNPQDPYGHMIGAKHPMFDQVMGQQQREPSIWDMMTAFGAAGLNSQGGNWFGAGAQAVNELMQESPGALSGLEALQANNELFELDERRRQAQMERRQQQRRQTALERVANDPNADPYLRQRANFELEGIGDMAPEAPGNEWEARTVGNHLLRINPDTGEKEVVFEGDSRESYGTSQNLVELGLDENGEPRYGVLRLGSQGAMEIQELPAGATPRMTPGYEEELARAQQRGRATGKDEGESIAQFPVVEENAFQMTSLIDDLLADEAGIQRTFGVMSKFPSIPGGKAADYEARLARLGGMSFLQAYQSLKGGGQITEVEGQQAKDAIVALATAQSPDQFKRELQRLKQAVTRIYERERSRYMPDRPSIFGEPAGMSGHDPLGILQ